MAVVDRQGNVVGWYENGVYTPGGSGNVNTGTAQIPGWSPNAPAPGADPNQPAPPNTPTGPSGPSAPFDATSNPYYQQMLASINASGAADAADTRAAVQQALIGFGFVPGGFKDRMGALDAATRALIEKNTQTGISGYARLLESRSEGIKDLVNSLQARGLRRSGAKGYGLKRNQLAFDRNFADATSNLLGGIGNRYSQYAQNESARQNQLAQMMMWVYQNYYTPPQNSTSSLPTNTQSSNSPNYLGGITDYGREDGNTTYLGGRAY